LQGLRFERGQPNQVIIMNEDLNGANLAWANLT
jgi:hypothetical protein